MKKLIQGIVDFQTKLTKEKQTLFSKLAKEQQPDALMIACADSRVVPNLFASTDPGDLFVVRNVGNLVPSSDKNDQETSVGAALEFSLLSLNVSDIIICGHSECGAMQALLDDLESLSPSHLKSWLQYGLPSLEEYQKGLSLDPSLSPLNQLSQINVLKQIEHLSHYPDVCKRLESQTLRLHGWWFDIAAPQVYSYEEEWNKFVPIDEAEATRLFARLP
ncbi:MAG: Carbonic anhydrase 1 [Chlamydiae bacterium]|nr:Carbonic anhydrase 1 [Chlamydiota bacterium]